MSITGCIRDILEKNGTADFNGDVLPVLKQKGFQESKKGTFQQLYYKAKSELKSLGRLGKKPTCQYCKKECNPQGIKSHERHCPSRHASNGKGSLADAVAEAATQAEVVPQEMPINEVKPPVEEHVEEPCLLTPLQLAVRVSKLSRQVGGLGSLSDLAKLCETHGAVALAEAISVARKIGIEQFKPLVEKEANEQAIRLCLEMGTGQFAEIVSHVGEIVEEHISLAKQGKDKPEGGDDQGQ